jgi:hypothetical protein
MEFWADLLLPSGLFGPPLRLDTGRFNRFSSFFFNFGHFRFVGANCSKELVETATPSWLDEYMEILHNKFEKGQPRCRIAPTVRSLL